MELDGVWTVNKRETLKKLDMTRFHSLFLMLVTGIHFFFLPQILKSICSNGECHGNWCVQ
jgi:hypothetical protein